MTGARALTFQIRAIAAPLVACGFLFGPMVYVGSTAGTGGTAGTVHTTDDLRRLIHEGFRDPEPKPRAVAMPPWFQWSGVVNDLACRIEYANDGGYAVGYTVMVRLENRGTKPMKVPMGNPRDSKPARIFELHARHQNESWAREPWLHGEHLDGPGPEVEWNGIVHPSMEAGNDADRMDLTLKPGESALAYLCGAPFQTRKTSEIKVVIRRAATEDPNTWHGVLESPPFPADLTEKKLEASAGTLQAPDYFPEWNHIRFKSNRMCGDESEVHRLRISNAALVKIMAFYEPTRLCKVLEGLMAAEQDLPMKLLLASEAAPAGSESAAQLILDCLSDTDGQMVMSTLDAMKRLVYRYENRVPQWLLALTNYALHDDRRVTGTGMATWRYSAGYRVSYLAEHSIDLPGAFGYTKCKEAVPMLLELLKDPDGYVSDTIQALGSIGDERAVPTLLEMMADDARTGGHQFRSLARALGALKAKEAVPALLKHLRYDEAIEALASIGDPCAVPALQALINSEGRIDDSEDNHFESASDRLVAAKIAVAALDTTARTQKLCELLNEPDFDRFDRRLVVRRLGDEPDPKAIPFLLKAIKEDSSGTVVYEAITTLSAFRHKDAITALIDCFDVNFQGMNDWSRASTPDGFRRIIARSLQRITGEDIEPDKEQWSQWWNTRGVEIDWSVPPVQTTSVRESRRHGCYASGLSRYRGSWTSVRAPGPDYEPFAGTPFP